MATTLSAVRDTANDVLDTAKDRVVDLTDAGTHLAAGAGNQLASVATRRPRRRLLWMLIAAFAVAGVVIALRRTRLGAETEEPEDTWTAPAPGEADGPAHQTDATPPPVTQGANGESARSGSRAPYPAR